MTAPRPNRKLAAILAVDVVGYARLMERDEPGTLGRLKALRKELVGPLLAEHRGRLVKLMGDGALCDFGSVVDAVECALAIQRGVREREAGRAEDERIRLRIGVNLGDVVRETDGDLYGDGVNVAARLEQLAEPGGVVVSGAAHDHLQGKLGCGFEDLGERRLKNIARPVRALRVAPDRAEPAHGLAAAPPLPDKPSLAVLPFADMGSDPAQGYFADGITEELTTAVARCRWLFVAARNSSFAYKGQAADVRRVGRELGVRYVLQGSVRRAGDRLRITGQLVEAESGAHVWADRHDGTLEDVFELQDRVTASVVAAIEPVLMSAEAERARRLRPASLAAYDLFLRALSLCHASGRQGTDDAVRLLSLATTADPGYAPSHALLAQCYAVRLGQGWCDDIEGERREGARLAHTAVERGRDDPSVLSMAGFALGNCSREYETAAAWLDRSLALNPNSAAASAHSGWLRCYLGEPEEAIERFCSALRSSPIDPALYSFQSGLALALHLAGRHEEALQWAAKSLAEQPGWLTAQRVLAASLARLGRAEEAREAVRRLLELWPGYRVRETRLHFRPSACASGYIQALLEAGAPE